MEATGLAIGIVGLAGLFSVCLQLLETISSANNLGPTYQALLCKLEVEKVLLLRWGETAGLFQSTGLGAPVDTLLSPDKRLEDPRIASAIFSTLSCMKSTFVEALEVSSRYGRKTDTSNDVGGLTQITAVHDASPGPSRRGPSSSFHAAHAKLQFQSNSSQAQASFRKKALWALQDEAKLKKLVMEIRSLNESLSRLLPEIEWRKRQADVTSVLHSPPTAAEHSDVLSADARIPLYVSEHPANQYSTIFESVSLRPGCTKSSLPSGFRDRQGDGERGSRIECWEPLDQVLPLGPSGRDCNTEKDIENPTVTKSTLAALHSPVGPDTCASEPDSKTEPTSTDDDVEYELPPINPNSEGLLKFSFTAVLESKYRSLDTSPQRVELYKRHLEIPISQEHLPNNAYNTREIQHLLNKIMQEQKDHRATGQTLDGDKESLMKLLIVSLNMQELEIDSRKDSRRMMVLAMVTMMFLPASFVAQVVLFS